MRALGLLAALGGLALCPIWFSLLDLVLAGAESSSFRWIDAAWLLEGSLGPCGLFAFAWYAVFVQPSVGHGSARAAAILTIASIGSLLTLGMGAPNVQFFQALQWTPVTAGWRISTWLGIACVLVWLWCRLRRPPTSIDDPA